MPRRIWQCETNEVLRARGGFLTKHMGASTSVAGGTIEKAAAYDRQRSSRPRSRSRTRSAADAQALLGKMRAAIAPPEIEKTAEDGRRGGEAAGDAAREAGARR